MNGAFTIALAQIDTTVGDLAGNAERIVWAAAAAHEHGAHAVVFPEMALCGYPPRDLLFDDDFVDAIEKATRGLAGRARGLPTLLVGTPRRATRPNPGHPGLHNSIAIIENGEIIGWRDKQLLPSYDVFNEPRWFVPAPPQAPIPLCGISAGIMICEDMWDAGYKIHPAAFLAAQGAQFLICASASPYRHGILEQRRAQAARAGLPMLYVNAVGAQDELIFDGGSFVMDGDGVPLATLPRHREALLLATLAGGRWHDTRVVELDGGSSFDRGVFSLLAMGIRDFALKNRMRHAVLGLSGGVDSALVACLAAAALGGQGVTAVAMPSRYSDARSTDSARELAQALGIEFATVPIQPAHLALEALLQPLGNAAENLQARLRAVILMNLVNQRGGFLLNTSNKTELTLGYGTLYGDLAGTLAPIGDLTKPQVYELARQCAEIPRFILERPPSAELRPEQVDPFDYPVESPYFEDIVAGHTPGTSADRRRIHAAEHKRRQGPVILKVSERAFGSGRMVPLTYCDWRDTDEVERVRQEGLPAAAAATG
jgi:NAD+ synthase (glutamine-hydrolysing)